MTVGAVALFSAACIIAGGIAMAGDGNKVATGVDPYLVTAKRLRYELDKTGISIRFVHPDHELVQTVSGVGKSGEALVAFEFQLYPTSEQATVERLGTLKPQDFDWSAGSRLIAWEARLRGVLANVAYAEYERVHIEETRREPSQVRRRRDRARRRVLRALDDALFNSFPLDDSFAHAVLPKPPNSSE